MVREETVRYECAGVEAGACDPANDEQSPAARGSRLATVLGLTARQVRRLIAAGPGRQAISGPRASGTGQAVEPTALARAEGQGRVLQLYARSTYRDFGPTLAAEKLAERQGITLSAETLRQWLLATRDHAFPRGGSGRTGRGGPGQPTWGHSSNWTARTMTGSRGAGLDVC